MTDLIELAAKCEKAAGPNREIDGLIFKALEQRDEDMWTTFGDENVWHRRDPQDHCAFDPPLNFTDSLDAAMTLLPEGYSFALGNLNDANFPWACVTDPEGIDYTCLEDAATPTLALVSAILRARASLKGEG